MFSFVFFTSFSGDVKRLLGTFPRCDHVDRVLLGVNGYRLKVMGACPALSRPSQAPASVGRPLAGKYRAFIATHSRQFRARCHLCTGKHTKIFTHQAENGRHYHHLNHMAALLNS